MTQKLSESHDLPDFLKANTAAIIERWVAVTRLRVSSPPSEQLSFDEFRDDVPEVLHNLADFLERRREVGESSDFKEVAEQHGHCRWRQGFKLQDLIRDWGNLQRVVLEWVNDFYEAAESADNMDRSTATNLVTAFFTDAVCGSVAQFDKLRQDDAARLARELKRLRHHFDRIEAFRERWLKDLSHDVRSPLTAISGASSMLKSEGNGNSADVPEVFDELAAIIEESLGEAMQHLDALRELSHIDSGLAELSPVRLDVAALLREVLDERWAAAGDGADLAAIDLSGPGELEVEADAERLRRTLESLLVCRGADGPAKPAPVQKITLRQMEDGWGLQLCYASPVVGNHAGDEAPHEDIDAALLRRLCLIQLASFQSEESSGGGQTVTLKFPLDYPE